MSAKLEILTSFLCMIVGVKIGKYYSDIYIAMRDINSYYIDDNSRDN